MTQQQIYYVEIPGPQQLPYGSLRGWSLQCAFRLFEVNHCTMCILGSTMAQQSNGYNRKNTFSRENNSFEAIFPILFQKENFKNCIAFHFPALEALFLEHSKSVKMTQKSQIQSLKITVSLKIKFSFQPTKLRQIYVE